MKFIQYIYIQRTYYMSHTTFIFITSQVTPVIMRVDRLSVFIVSCFNVSYWDVSVLGSTSSQQMCLGPLKVGFRSTVTNDNHWIIEQRPCSIALLVRQQIETSNYCLITDELCNVVGTTRQLPLCQWSTDYISRYIVQTKMLCSLVFRMETSDVNY